MTAPAGFVPHPTVPYGQQPVPSTVLPPQAPAQFQPQPGVQPGTQIPVQQQPSPSGWGQPGAPQPGAAPNPQQPQFPASTAPTFPAGQQPPFAAPQPQPVQVPQQQPQNTIPDHVVLDGPGVPPELRGRTFGQMKQIYSALATEFVQRQGRGPQQQQPAQQPQQQQQPQAPRQQAPQADDETRQFWENPARYIRGAVREEAQAIMAPVSARSQAQAIQEARAIAASGIPDFQMLEPEMVQALTQLDPAALADPRTWNNVADLTRGRLMAQNRYGAQPQQPQQSQQPVYRPAGPGSYVPAPMAPIPQQPLPQGQFFSEAPTPPQSGWFTGQGTQRQLTPEQQNYARKMGMSDQQYIDWSGGIQPTASARRF